MQYKWHIYALLDPMTKRVRYIGWSGNPYKRLNDHCNGALRVRSYKAHWIQGLLRTGHRPLMVILESGCDARGYIDAEPNWIAYYRSIGAPLTNATLGGEGCLGWKPTMLTRQKMSRARKGRKLTPQAIEKIRKALTGRKQHPAVVEKSRIARLGHIPTAAILAAAEANRGSKHSKEHIASRIHEHRPQYRVLTKEDVWHIRHSHLTYRELAQHFKVSLSTLFDIRHYKTYRDITI
jgi:hypothetical protein